MIKVVEVISDTNIGGAGNLLIARLKHSDRRLFDIAVAVPRGSLLTKRLRSQGIKVYEINACRDRSFDLLGVFAYFFLFKRISPDIVNSHGCLSARIAARLVSVPVKLYTRHCVYPVEKSYRCAGVRYVAGLFTSFLSDRVIAVAHSAKKNLMQMGIKQEKICVIINGSERLRQISENERQRIRQELDIEENAVVVTICARLEECKDHECFLRAAKILSSHSRGYKFLILGGGSLEKKLKLLSYRLGLEQSVIFLGFVEDVAPYMNITDINVNCSIGTETSSLALSEGMSIGVPAVVSNYGGNPYMVRNRENGYVYRAGDYVMLARLIEKLARNDRYADMSAAAKRRFENELNAKTMTEKTEKLYLNEYKKKRPRR